MFKFATLFILMLFGGTGLYMLFSNPDKPDMSAIASKVIENGTDLPFKTNYDVSASLAERVAGECYGKDAECSVFKIYEYVKNNFKEDINHSSTEDTILSEVIINRKGNKNSLDRLLSSLFNHAGVESFMENIKGENVVYACDMDVPKLYGQIKHYLNSQTLAKRDITLKKNGIWAVDLTTNDGKSFSIGFSASSLKPFDILLFPTKSDMNDYITDGSGRYIENCSYFGLKQKDSVCVVPFGSQLVFMSKEDDNTFKGRIFREGFLISDIKVKDKDGRSCVAMNMKY